MDKMNNRIISNLSITLFGILALTFLISSVGFIFHIPVNVFNILIPFIAGIYYLYKMSETGKEFLIQIIILLLIISVSYGISLTFWDDTWDGRSYHAATIIMLKNGWLPLYDNISEITQKLSLYPYNTQFPYTYVKFSEIVGANIYNLTGYIESSKIPNLIFLCSLFMYSFVVIKSILNKNIISFILSLCVCLNLPCVYQLLTTYVDIQIYIAFTFIILIIIKIEKSKLMTSTDIFLLILSSLMLSTVKLTGLVYFTVIYFCWIIYKLLQKEEVKRIIVYFCITVFLILITCINPFYTNWKYYSHPFYPVLGPKSYDVEHANYPRGFKNKTPLQRFLISTFSESTNSIENHDWESLNQPIYWKIPFTRIKEAPLSKFEYPDMRVGGFGYYWSGILCLTILLMFFLRFKSKEDKKLFLFLILTIALTVAANQYSWWARFVPQFWLIPILTLLTVFSDKNVKFLKISKTISYICIFFIFYNAILPVKYHLQIKYDFTNYYKNLFDSIKKESVSNSIYFMQNKNYNTNLADETIKIHLKENNIKLIEVDYDKNKISDEEFISLQQFNPIFEEYYFYKPVYKKE